MKCLSILSTLAILVALFALAGCGGDDGGGTQIMPLPVTKTVTNTVEVVPDLPDLTADIPHWFGYSQMPDTPHTFHFRATNNGTVASPVSSLGIRMYTTSSWNTTDEIQMLYEGSLTVPGLDPGESTGELALTADATPPEGHLQIRIELSVDPVDSIEEINEDNNETWYNYAMSVIAPSG